uniref:Small ribosomal subunit protein mS23 conserved domain-containing protein n=1 Tax=Ciona savignyi TaxID=51511 RepID=H2ZFA9_CIOSA
MSVAGSRLHRLGSVYSRTKDLIQSKVLPYEERPIWYDVYKAFPPHREPVYKPQSSPNQFGLVDVEDTVRPILYNEDWVRANVYGNPAFSNLNGKKISSLFVGPQAKNYQEGANFCHRFILKFEELKKTHCDLNNEDLFRLAEKEMIEIQDENQ